MLGEALPPLRLLLQDSHGNAVPAESAAWSERQVQLQVLQDNVAGGGAVLQELNVVADMVGNVRLCLPQARRSRYNADVTTCLWCGGMQQMQIWHVDNTGRLFQNDTKALHVFFLVSSDTRKNTCKALGSF